MLIIYISLFCDDTDAESASEPLKDVPEQVDYADYSPFIVTCIYVFWRRSGTYGRAPNAIDIS